MYIHRKHFSDCPITVFIVYLLREVVKWWDTKKGGGGGGNEFLNVNIITVNYTHHLYFTHSDIGKNPSLLLTFCDVFA